MGTYSISNSFLDLYILAGMGMVGYILRKLKFDMALLILLLDLRPMLERTLRQSLFLTRGDVGLIVSRPITAVLLSTDLIALVLPLFLRRGKNAKARG